MEKETMMPGNESGKDENMKLRYLVSNGWDEIRERIKAALGDRDILLAPPDGGKR